MGVTAPPAGISRATPEPTSAARKADLIETDPPDSTDAVPEKTSEEVLAGKLRDRGSEQQQDREYPERREIETAQRDHQHHRITDRSDGGDDKQCAATKAPHQIRAVSSVSPSSIPSVSKIARWIAALRSRNPTGVALHPPEDTQHGQPEARENYGRRPLEQDRDDRQ